MEKISKNKEGKLCFHGTNKENALKILNKGFEKGTHFAKHLEDSLEFGGSWVFMVWFKEDYKNWQFVSNEKIPISKVFRLTQYRPIVRIGTQSHLTRKVDSKIESNNLIGKPL